MSNGIDFVITWVDGNDENWLKEKSKYLLTGKLDAAKDRYRDWENLKYLFRGIEKFVPWVQTIHFITCGHLPSWLNVDSPKLNIVNHKDYIPKEYLPTFNSRTIEHNLFRLNELSERFVLLNDDMFFIAETSENLFFDGNVPRHPIWLRHIVPEPYAIVPPHVYINDMSLINRHFNAVDSYNLNKHMWESEELGEEERQQNKFYLKYDKFSGFRNEHLAVPILKTTMNTIWNLEFEILNETCKNKFRTMNDVNQYIYRYWQIASGNCKPIRREKLGKYYVIGEDNSLMYKDIENQKYPMICINDMNKVTDEEKIKIIINELNVCFEKILPDKSSFEM